MWLFGRASFDLSRKLGLGGYLLVIEVLFFQAFVSSSKLKLLYQFMQF